MKGFILIYLAASACAGLSFSVVHGVSDCGSNGCTSYSLRRSTRTGPRPIVIQPPRGLSSKEFYYGVEPACWIGEQDLPGKNSSSRQALEGAWLANPSYGDMMPCADGFHVEITLPQAKGGAFLVNQPYTFNVRGQVHTKFNESLFTGSTTVENYEPVSRLHVRLILCDARKTGICSPEASSTDTVVSNAHQINQEQYIAEEFVVDFTHSEYETAFTPYNTIKFTHQETNSTGGINDELIFSLDVPLELRWPPQSTSPRSYFLLGQATFFTVNEAISSSKRVDIVNSIPEHVVIFQEPEILENTLGFQVALGIILAVVVIAELSLFVMIIYHQKHQIMQLAQAPLLALLVLAGATATGCCYLFMPINDWFCNLSQPLVVIPLTLVASILVGRIWRINAVLSPALRIGGADGGPRGERGDGIKMVVMRCIAAVTEWESCCFLQRCCCCRCCRRNNGFGTTSSSRKKSIRQKVTMKRLWRLIFVLMLPQVTLQVLSAVLDPATRTVVYNSSFTVGRATCRRDHAWVVWVGYFFVVVPYVAILFLAWFTRYLPSLFNETVSIFYMAKITLVVLLIGTPLLGISSVSLMSPDITTFLFTSIVLSLVLTPCATIIVQKLRMVWKGEKIVVSELLLRPFSASDASKFSSPTAFCSDGSSKSLKSSTTGLGSKENNSSLVSYSENERTSETSDVASRDEPSVSDSKKAEKRETVSSVSFAEDTVFGSASLLESTVEVAEAAPSNTSAKSIPAPATPTKLSSSNAGTVIIRSTVEDVHGDDEKSVQSVSSLAVGRVTVEDGETYVVQFASGEETRPPLGISGHKYSDIIAKPKGSMVKQESARTFKTEPKELYLRATPPQLNEIKAREMRRSSTPTIRTGTAAVRDEAHNKRSTNHAVDGRKQRGKEKRRPPMFLSESEPLPARLDRSILVMKEILTKISVRSMAGRTVPIRELELLKSKGERFGEICGSIVITNEDDQSFQKYPSNLFNGKR